MDQSMDWMETSKPAISVLMSVYNGQRWLREAIESVMAQTFTDYEFIILNDGSTDRSLEIMKEFAHRDSRIVVVNKSNTGLADSLNCGIAQAKGNWIARIDADDLCLPERLKRQYDLACSDSQLVLIGTGFVLTDNEGRSGKEYRLPVSHERLLIKLFSQGEFFPHSSAFYKTEVVRKIGGYRPRIKRAQDYDLWLRLSEEGRLACIDAPLVKIRKHEDQISYDEKGRRQFVDAHVALLSYWLKRKGAIDPVSDEVPEEVFLEFRQWVDTRLQQSGLVADFDFLQELKCSLMSKKPKPCLRLVMRLLFHPSFLWRYLKRRWLGEGLIPRLAEEWIRINLKDK